MTTKIKYFLVTDLLGNNANSWNPKTFTSIEEATKCWEEEYKNRNKNDGYDDNWRKTPLRIQQVIENNLWDEQ